MKLPRPDQQIADAMAKADAQDGLLADLIPDSNSRGVVIEATSEAFVLGSRILAAISLDSMHQKVLKARLARGQAARCLATTRSVWCFRRWTGWRGKTSTPRVGFAA